MKDFFFEVSRYQWNRPGNPSIYATTLLPIDNLLQELESHGNFSQRDLLSFVSFAIYKVLPDFPRLNSYFFMNSKKTRDHINLSYMVMTEHEDTSLFIHPISFAKDLKINKLKKIIYLELGKGRKDPLRNVKFASTLLRNTPSLFRRLFFKIFYFLTKQNAFKLINKICPHDMFGSIIISYVGMLGLPSAYIPLLKHGNNSLILAIGKIEKKLEFDENKNIVEKKYLQLSWTVDHRHTHGQELANFYKAFQEYFDNPKKFFH